jgi:PD-(D/E)XK nuclease superfamily
MRCAMNKKETDHYEEMAKELALQFESNLINLNKTYVIKPLIGEIQSGLRTLIVNGYDAGDLLRTYTKQSHKLHLDISIVIENKISGKFEIVIFEVKKVQSLGLAELSQLIGYCLVSKAKYGILVNVDKSVSSQFSTILEADKDLTNIIRFIDKTEMTHRLGVMIWNSKTLNIEYTNSGSIKTMPQLISLIEDALA